MDKFYKSIKFVSLLEQSSSCYLTACEDKKTVTLVRKNDWSGCGEAAPKGAEWRLKWIQDSTGVLTGKFRLHSIYKKVLSVRREGGWPGYLKVFQSTLPAPNDRDTVIEWSINLKQKNYRGGEMEAQFIIEYEQVSYFLAGPQTVMCNYDRYASPRVEFLNSACRKNMHNWKVTQLFNTEQQLQKRKQKQLDEAKKLNTTTTSSNNNNSLPATAITTAASTTAATTITTASREVVAVKSASAYNGQMSQLTGWQVGQVVLNYFNAGVGSGYSLYNTGQNANGSGTQSNGSVNVDTEYGSTKDVSVNFISNKS